MTVNKTFCKFTNGGFCRTIAGRERKSISKVKIYSSKNKMVPLPWWEWSDVIILPPSIWLITLENSAIWEILCRSLLLADRALRGGCSQAGHGEWMSMLLFPCIPSIRVIMATLVTSHQGMTGVAGERWLISTKQVILSTSADVTDGEHSCGTQLSSHSETVWRNLSTYLSQMPSIFQVHSFQITSSELGQVDQILIHRCLSVFGRRYVLGWGNFLEPRQPQRGVNGKEPSCSNTSGGWGNKFFTDEGVQDQCIPGHCSIHHIDL